MSAYATCITALRTEQAYVNWVRAFIRFHGVRHPATLGSSEVEAFLVLAGERARKVSVSTHRQALAALLFFYGKVLCTDLPLLQRSEDPAVAALAGGADPG